MHVKQDFACECKEMLAPLVILLKTYIYIV